MNLAFRYVGGGQLGCRISGTDSAPVRSRRNRAMRDHIEVTR